MNSKASLTAFHATVFRVNIPCSLVDVYKHTVFIPIVGAAQKDRCRYDGGTVFLEMLDSIHSDIIQKTTI